MTNILSIETSCDETAAAFIQSSARGIKVLGSTVASQIKIHEKTSGVVPEVAARAHIKKMSPVILSTLRKSGKSLDDVDLFAVTSGPGLISSLLVGIEYVKGLGLATGKKVLAVNHMHGHLYSPLLENPKFKIPNISLIVSGGHTYLILMKSKKDFKVIGQTVDDAVGEAFDKVAKMLNLPYPGGPQVSIYAERGKKDYNFPRPILHSGDFNFSFAGLKTAVLYKLRDEKLNPNNEKVRADISMSFQNAAVDVLVQKTIKAALKYKAKSISLSGGVAANKTLRSSLNKAARKNKLKFYVPSFALCTDNASMIGNAAAVYLQNGKKPSGFATLKVDPDLVI